MMMMHVRVRRKRGGIHVIVRMLHVLVGAASVVLLSDLTPLCDALTNVTLPPPAADGGLYVIDVQAQYPAANWSDVDRLYIPAGHYKFLRLGNLPDRCGIGAKPLIITNLGGQVRVGGKGFYYVMTISGGCNWKLTGKFDAVEQTGHIDYQGHADGAYADSQGTYGILIDDAYSACEDGQEGCPYNLTSCANRPSPCPNEVAGLTVGSNAPSSQPQPPTSDFEISYIEITDTGFAGLVVKTDNKAGLPCGTDGQKCESMADYTMRNVKIHDMYIHDVLSEGMYLGSTQNSDAQHSFENLRVYNNRVLRAGTEGIQAGQLGDGCEIDHNVVALSSIDWKDSFQTYQDNALQLGPRYGNISVHHNIFIGAADSIVSMKKMMALGDTHTEGDRVELYNNFFSSSRFLGVFMGVDYQPKDEEVNITYDNLTSYHVSNSTFRNFEFQRDEIYVRAINEDLVRVLQLTSDIFLTDNDLNLEAGLDRLYLAKWPYSNVLNLNGFSGDAIVGKPDGSINATGNSRTVVPPVKFQNFMPLLGPDVDYLLVERWSCNANNAGSAPIEYYEGDYVVHKKRLYNAKINNTCVEPGNTTYWEFVSVPVDDVRLACDGSANYQGIGLLDVATCTSDSCHKDAECTNGCYVCSRKCFKVKGRTLRRDNGQRNNVGHNEYEYEYEYECRHSLKCKDGIDNHDNIFEGRHCGPDVSVAHCFYEGDPCSIEECADADICPFA